MVTYKVELGNFSTTAKKIIYEDSFENGVLFSDIVENEKYALKEGFSFGDKPTTNTLKFKLSGTQAQIAIVAGYEYIRLFKNDNPYFEGIFSSISKTIVTSDFAEADITYKDYVSLLEDVKFPSEIEYFTANGIKICAPNDTSHSFVHIMFTKLFELATKQKFDDAQTNLFDLVCNYTDNTVIDYFSAGTSDNIYSVINEFLKEMGLGIYIHNRTITVIDICSSESGIAKTIKDVEQNMTIDDKPYNKVSIAPVSIGVVKTANNAEVVYIHEQNNGGGNRNGVVQFNYSDNKKIQVLKYSNPSYSFDSASGIGGRNVIRSLQFIGSGTSWSVSYNIHNNAWFKMHFTLQVRANVILMEQDKVIHATNADLEDKNANTVSTKYLHTENQAQRYMQAIYISAMRDRKTYNFYADQNLEIGDVVVINGLLQSEGVLKITEKTDNNDDFGGFSYKAVNLVDASGITFDADYIPKSEELPDTSSQFSYTVTRTIILARPDGTPSDNTPVKVVINPVNRLSVPTMKIGNETVELTQDTETLIDEETGDEYTATINQWHYDIPANLGGVNSIEVTITVGSRSEQFKVYKSTGTSIEYGIGSSPDNYATVSSWSSTQPQTTYEKPYIWQRTKYEGGDWVYICTNPTQAVLQSFNSTPQYVISETEDYISGVEQYDEYVETADEEPLLGKDYYTRREVFDYYQTDDEEPVEGKKYYILQGQDYVEADVSQGFDPEETYYERTINYEYDLAEDYTGFPIGFYENLKPYRWEDNILNWKKGYFIWQRKKIEYADGTIFYTEPYYDSENTMALLQSCRFEIFSDGGNFEVNKRASNNDENIVSAKVFMQGYGAVVLSSLVWNFPSSITLDYSGDLCRIHIPKNTNLEEITISISYEYREGLTDTTYLVLSATDVTGQFTFLGNLNTVPTNATSVSGEQFGSLIDGDCYNLIQNNTLTAYVRVNGQWKALGNAQKDSSKADTEDYPKQVSLCCNGYTESGYKGNGYVFSLGDSYTFLFTQQANIDALASQKITLIDGGSIKSDGYTYGEGGSFDLGIKGFYISSDGVAEFVSVRMKNSIVSGKFMHDALETFDGIVASEITAELDETVHYKHSDAYNALYNALPADSTVSAQITYKGVSYPKVHKTVNAPVTTITLASGQSWTNNTGNVVKIKEITSGSVNKAVNSSVGIGETVEYDGWDIEDLAEQITEEDTVIEAEGTYNDVNVSAILKANDISTELDSGISYNQSWSINGGSGNYQIPITTKRQSITISCSCPSGSYQKTIATQTVRVSSTGLVKVFLNGAQILTNSAGIDNSRSVSTTIVIQSGDVISWVANRPSKVENPYPGPFGISFSIEKTLYSDLGIVRQGLYFFQNNTWQYIGQTGIDHNEIDLTSPIEYTGNDAVFKYTSEYVLGINFCNNDGRVQRSILANTYATIKALEFTAIYQGVDVLANVTQYFHPFTVLQDDDNAPAFDAKMFDVEEISIIKWHKLGDTNNPNITASNISQFTIYWNGSNLFQVFRNNVPVYVLNENDFVTADFQIQFTPFGQIAHILTKDILPKDNGYYDIGSDSMRYRSVFTNKLPAPIATELIDTDSFYIEKSDGRLQKVVKADIVTPQIMVGIKGEQGEQGEQGEKGDTFTFEDLTPEEIAQLKTDTKTTLQRKYTYNIEVASGVTAVTIPDENYHKETDMLIVSVDGVVFSETKDYTRTTTGINLVNATETACTVEVQVLRAIQIDPSDYSLLKGDKGDKGDDGEDGAMSSAEVSAMIEDYVTGHLQAQVQKDINRDVIVSAGTYSYTVPSYVATDNVKVFINGLLAVLGVDYSLSSVGVITTLNSQSAGTEIVIIRERTYWVATTGTKTEVDSTLIAQINARVQQAEDKATEAKTYVDTELENYVKIETVKQTIFENSFNDFDLLWSGWQNSASWVALPLVHPYTDYKFIVVCYGTSTTQNHDICQTVLFVPALRFLSSNTSAVSDYGNFCYGYASIYCRFMVDDNAYPDGKTLKVWTSGTGLKYIYGVK